MIKNNKEKVEEIIRENNLASGWLEEPVASWDKFDFSVGLDSIFDALKFISEISDFAWCKLEQDYDYWIVYLKVGSHCEDVEVE